MEHNHVLLTNKCRYSWRRQRRAAQAALNKEAIRNFYPILTKEATLLVSALLTTSSSSDRMKHFQRAGTSVILSILYDYPTVISEHDTIIEEIDKYNKRTAYAAMPGNFLVELFPWMVYIPERSYSLEFHSLRILTRKRTPDLPNGRGKVCSKAQSTKNCFCVF